MTLEGRVRFKTFGSALVQQVIPRMLRIVYLTYVLLLQLSPALTAMSDDDGDKTAAKVPMAAAVSVKPPAFDDTSVSRWFKIVESQFLLSNITASTTKFHHIIANLPVRVLNQLGDAVIVSMSYNDLKNALESLFAKSKPKLFDTLMNQHKILCTKPTVYLQELRKLAAPLDVTDDFLRIKSLKALPNNIRPLLVKYNSNTSLEELAQVADTLLDYSGSNQQGSIMQQAGSSTISYVGSRSNGTSMTPTRDPDTTHRGRTPSVPDYSITSIPVGVHAFHATQRPKVCRYHLYYGNNAKSCKS